MTHSRCTGFTLIELLVTVTIAAVLLAVGIPSLQTFMINNSMSTQTNDLVTSLALARSEAVRRGETVTLSQVPSDFALGWTVTVGGTTLNEHGALRSGFTLAWSNGAVTAINYRPSGVSDANAGEYFTLCYPGYIGRTISISPTGRVSIANTASACP